MCLKKFCLQQALVYLVDILCTKIQFWLFMQPPLPWIVFSVGAGQGASLELSTLVSLYGGGLLRGVWLSSLQGLLVQASSSGGTAFGILCSEAN